jgi:hypothetical protein
MGRAIKCYKFQTSRLIKLTAGFTALFVAFYVFVTIILSFQNQNDSSNINYCFGASVFAFVAISALYKNAFNNLLMFGNTRRTIITSFFLCAVTFSATLTVLSELSDLLSTGISHIFKTTAISSLTYIYVGITEPQKLLWFFTLLLMAIMMAYVYSALSYKFGKIFRIVFWCGLGLLLMLTPIGGYPLGYAIGKAFKLFFGFRIQSGIYWCSLHFFIVSVVFGAILWLIVRRQPQNA